MLTLLAVIVVTQTPPDLKALRAENQASYDAALAGVLKRQKLTRVPMELVFDALVTKPGFKNVKIGAWHEPDREDIVPAEPVLVTDAKGVVSLAWPQPESKKTVAIEVAPKPPMPPGMPPMREIRALVPETLALDTRGSDITVTFKATTLERRVKKK